MIPQEHIDALDLWLSQNSSVENAQQYYDAAIAELQSIYA